MYKRFYLLIIVFLIIISGFIYGQEYALQFTGTPSTSYVQIPGSNSLILTGSVGLTLEAFVKLSQMPQSGPEDTAAELTIDEIRNLCDELIEAHGDYLPKYK